MYSTPPREGGYVPISRKENRGSEKTVIYDVAFCYKVHLETTSSLLVLPLSVYLSIHQRFIEHLLCTEHCSGCLGDSREENKAPCPPTAYLLMEGGAETGKE